MLQLMKFLNK